MSLRPPRSTPTEPRFPYTALCRSPLEASFARLIEAQGPQSVAAYMALCMAHREHGYYGRRDPLGRRGDLVTAPEISQVFAIGRGQVWTPVPNAHLVCRLLLVQKKA